MNVQLILFILILLLPVDCWKQKELVIMQRKMELRWPCTRQVHLFHLWPVCIVQQLRKISCIGTSFS